MENFISGYPGSEVVGSQKSEFFFDKFLVYFFEEKDAQFFKSLGLNCIRLSVNYRHFEDDINPRVLKKEGSKHLDRNIDWHSDAGTHMANFWIHKDFQDRTIWLWTELAKHYVGNRWIVGYNPLNEPTDSTHATVVQLYERVYDHIRSVDTEHTIFFDGNTFASDFFPEDYVSSDEQRRRMKRSYEEKREWMDQHGLCVWNGEWGPVYARKQYDGVPTNAINKQCYCVLQDQLAIYNESIWLYKDIGFQGMVYVSQETPYMALLKYFLAKKHPDTTHVRHIYQPLIDHIAKEIPPENQSLYPAPVWKMADRVSRLSRSILVAETEAELDEIAKSFKLENCLHRVELNDILTANAALVAENQGSLD
ncbi:glycoside hydrolase [Gyrodon lividus]|nr:glycoside hydrolase [Gyrodon lividus]